MHTLNEFFAYTPPDFSTGNLCNNCIANTSSSLVHGSQKAQLTVVATDSSNSSTQFANSHKCVELPPPRSSFTFWTMTIGWENAKVSWKAMSRTQGSDHFPKSLVTR